MLPTKLSVWKGAFPFHPNSGNIGKGWNEWFPKFSQEKPFSKCEISEMRAIQLRIPASLQNRMEGNFVKEIFN